MKRTTILLATLLLAAGWLAAQTPAPPGKAPVAQNPVLDVQGKITALHLGPGGGPPYLDVDTGRVKPVRVWLGSMRYLMEQKFNPKAGEMVQVRGFQIQTKDLEYEIVAISVKLPAVYQTLLLRDETTGYPVWQGRDGRGGWGCRHCDHPCPNCGR